MIQLQRVSNLDVSTIRPLVAESMEAAEGRFHMLTLRTENPEAARLYLSLGFVEEPAVAHATHWCRLPAPAPGGRTD
jgi:hypothetical protein